MGPSWPNSLVKSDLVPQHDLPMLITNESGFSRNTCNHPNIGLQTHTDGENMAQHIHGVNLALHTPISTNCFCATRFVLLVSHQQIITYNTSNVWGEAVAPFFRSRNCGEIPLKHNFIKNVKNMSYIYKQKKPTEKQSVTAWCLDDLQHFIVYKCRITSLLKASFQPATLGLYCRR